MTKTGKDLLTVCCSMFVYVIYSVLFKKHLTFKKNIATCRVQFAQHNHNKP